MKRKNLIPTWRDKAACLDAPAELFFPAGETGAHAVQADLAREVCSRCPVQMDCLREALWNAESGVWGGTTDAERKVLKTKLTRTQYVTVEALYEALTVDMPACANCGEHRKEKADGLCATCFYAGRRETENAEAV